MMEAGRIFQRGITSKNNERFVGQSIGTKGIYYGKDVGRGGGVG